MSEENDNLSRLCGESHYGITKFEAAGFIIFTMLLAWSFGVYDRHLFDDEINTLSVISRWGYGEIFRSFVEGNDFHPPLSFLVFRALSDLGLSPAEMRVVSFIFTLTAFLLIADLSLRPLRRIHSGTPVAPPLALFVFSTFPLLYGMGDALRWYPLFALLVAAFSWLYLRSGRPTLGAGAVLGLAASTNFLAAIPYVAFVIHRYGVKRRFSLRSDGLFHLSLVFFAWPAIVNFIALTQQHSFMALTLPHTVAPLGFGAVSSSIAALGITALGFFGGYRLGLLNGLLALPYLLFLAAFTGYLIRARMGSAHIAVSGDAADLSGFALILTFISIAFIVITGFDKPRSFLFLAPFVTAIFVLGHIAVKPTQHTTAASVCAVLILFSAVMANSRTSDAPFKRNLVIPFEQVERFVTDNTDGTVLVATAEYVSRYLFENLGFCVVPRSKQQDCFNDDLQVFDYVVLAHDHNYARISTLVNLEKHVQAERSLVAKGVFGYDREASLKTALTNVELEEWILTVEIYR